MEFQHIETMYSDEAGMASGSGSNEISALPMVTSHIIEESETYFVPQVANHPIAAFFGGQWVVAKAPEY